VSQVAPVIRIDIEIEIEIEIGTGIKTIATGNDLAKDLSNLKRPTYWPRSIEYERKRENEQSA
jgi:hypothetical protein